MAVNPTIIRASSLPSYADCPRRAAARMFRKEIEAAGYRLAQTVSGIGAAIGTATHFAARTMLGEKARSGELPPESVATDAALDTLTETVKRGVQYDQTSENQAAAVRQSLGMVKAYYRKVAPRLQPIAVEERLEAQIDDDLILSGQPDLIAYEPKQIDDLKTGTRQGNHNAQLGAYSLLARSSGIEIEAAAIDFVRRVRVGTPQPDPVRTVLPLALAEQAAMNVVRHIAQDLRVFKNGDDELGLRAGDPAAFLANPQSKLCSNKYCPAHGTSFCQEWRTNE